MWLTTLIDSIQWNYSSMITPSNFFDIYILFTIYIYYYLTVTFRPYPRPTLHPQLFNVCAKKCEISNLIYMYQMYMYAYTPI